MPDPRPFQGHYDIMDSPPIEGLLTEVGEPAKTPRWWKMNRLDAEPLSLKLRVLWDAGPPEPPRMALSPTEAIFDWPGILTKPSDHRLVIVPGAHLCPECGTRICDKCGKGFWLCGCVDRR